MRGWGQAGSPCWREECLQDPLGRDGPDVHNLATRLAIYVYESEILV